MNSTTTRFGIYVGREKEVADMVDALFAVYGEVSRILPSPNRTYDRILLLGGRVKLEIQITESADFERYGDIRLDLVSAFNLPQDCVFHNKHRIDTGYANRFLESIEIRQAGKLYSSPADTLVYYITEPTDMLCLYSMSKLQENLHYWLAHFPIMVNNKIGEEWCSCFIPVPIDNERLEECGYRLPRARKLLKEIK